MNILKGVLYLAIVFFFCCNFNEKNEHHDFADQDCPPEGTAQSERVMRLNRMKNRVTFPGENEFDTSISLAKMLAPGNDRKRFDSTKAARITGYVYEVKPGGVETCNCKAKDVNERDTHIELLLDPMNDAKNLRVVVEVTPRFRKIMNEKGSDWSTNSLRDKLLGRWVMFEGWLLFDEEHAGQAENTSPGRERNWRATAWEIHPVTGYTLTNKPR